MGFRVTAIEAGRFGLVRDDIKYLGGSPDIQSYVPSYVYLLERGEEQYLVDTSFPDPAFCQERMQLFVERGEPFLELLTRKGVAPDRVKGIFFTHLHWDHAGNVKEFPRAVLYCQKKELEAAKNQDNYPAEFLQEFWDAAGRLSVLEGDEEPVFGIKVHLCGGHTAGSQMIEVDVGEGRGLIPGDVIMTEWNFREQIPVGLCVSREEAALAVRYAKEEGFRFVLPSHEYYRAAEYMVTE